MTSHRPQLSDLQATRIQYQPGDRLLARVGFSPTAVQVQRLLAAVKRYTREDVNTLIINCRRDTLIRIKADKTEDVLASRKHLDIPVAPGAVRLQCSVIQFQPNDVLEFQTPVDLTDPDRKDLLRFLQSWAGPDVEVRVFDNLPTA